MSRYSAAGPGSNKKSTSPNYDPGKYAASATGEGFRRTGSAVGPASKAKTETAGKFIGGLNKEEEKGKVQAKVGKQEDSQSEQPQQAQKNFSHQAGGHQGAFQGAGEGRIAKKVGNNEFVFYTQTLQQHPDVKRFAPAFYGPQEKDGNKHIVLADLTAGFSKPCILDVKLGVSSVGEDASPEKKASMEAKDRGTTTHSLGMRITAMKVYQTDKADYVSLGKAWGKKVTPETMLESLSQFFNNGERLRTELIPSYLEKLGEIQEWINEQSQLRFYSSSVLFIYDGDESNSKVELKMIDFAHVHEIQDGGKDDGYIFGLQNLIDHLEKLQ
jgi:inositol-hexakisphosphate kinase